MLILTIKVLFLLIIEMLKYRQKNQKQKKENALAATSTSSHCVYIKIHTKNFHLELTIL